MQWKALANMLAGFQLFHCNYTYWRGKMHYPPKFPFQNFPNYTV